MNIYKKSDIPEHLQKYFEPAEIGLEQTPEQYIAAMVEVFRCVWDVLADDGVLWLNIGDSYARTGGTDRKVSASAQVGSTRNTMEQMSDRTSNAAAMGLKSKDLIGIPWMLAKALRDPYYTGQIKDERDRVWLAAIIDGEGCFFIHKRNAGAPSYSKFTRADGTQANYTRTADTFGVGLEICNTSKAIIDRVQAIVGGGTVTTQSPQQNARRKQTIYRWRVAPNEAKRIAQEVYPHLVGKQHQARLLFNCPSTGDAGAAAHKAMMDLHNGVEVSIDYPAPPSLFDPGWFLRQDVIWSKPNAMPESVRDRCTKAHEYLFLLTKSERYYFDAVAIQEDAQIWTGRAGTFDRSGNPVADHVIPGQSAAQHRPRVNERDRKALRTDVENRHRSSIPGGQSLQAEPNGKRNRRSVWTVPTQPYSGAHFAVFPAALIEPCVLAGSRPGDVVLDPFMGSGTTAQVAQALGRQWIGCELNTEYAPLQQARTAQAALAI